MGFFDTFKKKTKKPVIEDRISKRYRQKYFKECRYIWKQYVPKSGQAQTLQGELLREIERLRCEAQDNGNINFDDDYFYFCDFIAKALTEQSIFSEAEKNEIRMIMAYLKGCGEYAQKYNNGEIEENDMDPNKIAYTGDNLYNIICDRIGKLQKEHPEPIPYEANTYIRR